MKNSRITSVVTDSKADTESADFSESVCHQTRFLRP